MNSKDLIKIQMRKELKKITRSAYSSLGDKSGISAGVEHFKAPSTSLDRLSMASARLPVDQGYKQVTLRWMHLAGVLSLTLKQCKSDIFTGRFLTEIWIFHEVSEDLRIQEPTSLLGNSPQKLDALSERGPELSFVSASLVSLLSFNAFCFAHLHQLSRP